MRAAAEADADSGERRRLRGDSGSDGENGRRRAKQMVKLLPDIKILAGGRLR